MERVCWGQVGIQNLQQLLAGAEVSDARRRPAQVLAAAACKQREAGRCQWRWGGGQKIGGVWEGDQELTTRRTCQNCVDVFQAKVEVLGRLLFDGFGHGKAEHGEQKRLLECAGSGRAEICVVPIKLR